ncbi:putative pentatricopeptide repeat-containing protein At3g01580 [Amaranthus tricolor]|uniref:putative pentatricopeptide repeat-containing protein At3g01580 n=1 Tax=Amaranthus tricolor TaxID=29722 RepID=UPI0025826B35|nr:putative pentatricopeptide repeat-containing protein At3g01580 [Amaranthus tricolor]XP_057543615.1 putative pentatricopeptide repeat-containing protein At3g01580 [Amaranthus tricolor]XP_057543616.1 putative pentatricopeptide repeat-containing protein At3g01580 [Amaranthus tricolor]
MLKTRNFAICASRRITIFIGLKRFHLANLVYTQQYHNQSSSFYSSILKSINNSTTLLQLHAQITTSGAFANSVYLSNNLKNAYINIGLISKAHKVFDQILEKNIVSWTILISGFMKRKFFYDAVGLFAEMIKNGLLPNEVTISSILPAFGNLGLNLLGKSMHCFWVRRGFEHNIVVETSLIDMYCRFGCMNIAQILFDEMPKRNVVSWNVVISGYASNGIGDCAFHTFNLMRKNGVSLDYFTIMSLLSASCRPNQGRLTIMIHGFIIGVGYYKERQIQTSLIDMYISGNFIDEAYGVFNEMVVKDVVTWTMMLKGFSTDVFKTKAIEHVREMISEHSISLDSTALVSMISCLRCSEDLPLGKLIHGIVVTRGFDKDAFVGCALIGMYAHCGESDSAKRYFDGMENRDVTCWNAMIRAMGVNGNGNDAISLLWRMEDMGFSPNESTFVSVLSACSHAGMIDEGLQIFYHMAKRRGIVPNLQHYGCLVDLLGRSGRLDDANSVIARMPFQPNSEVYGALLSACRVYGNSKVGDEIYQKLLKIDITGVGHLCSLSNLYSSLGDWEGKEMSHMVLRSKGMKKDLGYSLIEMNKQG